MFGDYSIFKEKCGKYSYTTVKFYDGNGKSHRKRFPDSKAGEREAKQFAKELCQNVPETKVPAADIRKSAIHYQETETDQRHTAGQSFAGQHPGVI